MKKEAPRKLKLARETLLRMAFGGYTYTGDSECQCPTEYSFCSNHCLQNPTP